MVKAVVAKLGGLQRMHGKAFFEVLFEECIQLRVSLLRASRGRRAKCEDDSRQEFREYPIRAGLDFYWLHRLTTHRLRMLDNSLSPSKPNLRGLGETDVALVAQSCTLPYRGFAIRRGVV